MKISKLVKKMNYHQLKIFVEDFKNAIQSTYKDKKVLRTRKRILKRLLNYLKRVEKAEIEERKQGSRHGIEEKEGD